MTQTAKPELPNLFHFENGDVVRSKEDWARRRCELRDLIVDIEYGGMPPVPSGVTGQPLHTTSIPQFGDASYTQYRIMNDDHPSFHFRLDLLVPKVEGPLPVVLNGDGCWGIRFITEEVTREILKRGFALAQFSRTAIVPDIYNSDRDTGLYCAYPDLEFGAIAAWAWGYHRCIDFLSTLDSINSDQIAAIGHSRGGKTALLAGATDERIALTSPNGSGSGGAGCFRCQGPDSEALADSMKMIPYWYGPKFGEYIGRENELPFDQHFLKALIAPRAYLSTEGLGDLWSNPSGTWQSHQAAREAYKFLDAESQIGIWYREGEHDHGASDWHAFLEFMDWRFGGKEPDCQFEQNPYPEMPKAYTWSSPRID
jgi:dienelactone hydrolase